MALKVIVKDQGGTGVQKHMMSTCKTVAESSAFAVRKLLAVDRSNAPWLKSFPKIMQNPHKKNKTNNLSYVMFQKSQS